MDRCGLLETLHCLGSGTYRRFRKLLGKRRATNLAGGRDSLRDGPCADASARGGAEMVCDQLQAMQDAVSRHDAVGMKESHLDMYGDAWRERD